MTTEETQPFKGGKEEQLAIVRDNIVFQQSPQEQVYTSDDAEHQSYRQLLQGFFDKLNRWNDICEDEKFKRAFPYPNDVIEKYRDFCVLQTRRGNVIRDDGDDTRKILLVTRYIGLNEPEDHLFHTRFIIRPGQAGEHLLTDPEGRAIREATFDINDQRLPGGVSSKSLSIHTEYPPPDDLTPSVHKAVYYQVGRGQIEISSGGYLRLPESYQTHLFDTIDGIIPKSPTPQNERRESIKLPKPLALLARRIRRPER